MNTKQAEQKQERQQANYKDLPHFNRLVEEVRNKQHHQKTDTAGRNSKQYEQK